MIVMSISLGNASLPCLPISDIKGYEKACSGDTCSTFFSPKSYLSIELFIFWRISHINGLPKPYAMKIYFKRCCQMILKAKVSFMWKGKINLNVNITKVDYFPFPQLIPGTLCLHLHILPMLQASAHLPLIHGTFSDSSFTRRIWLCPSPKSQAFSLPLSLGTEHILSGIQVILYAWTCPCPIKI